MTTRLFFCVGSLNADITFVVPRMPKEHEKLRCSEAFFSCGGSAANTAFWLARLGQPVKMIGCIGDDPLGNRCLDSLVNAGVDIGWVRRASETMTGVAAIFVNPNSKRMITSGGANTRLGIEHDWLESFRPNTHLHLATSMREIVLPLLEAAKTRGATTSCDLDEALDAAMFPLLDFCFINHTELQRRFGHSDPQQVLGAMTGARKPILVVTWGGRGAGAYSGEGKWFAPAPPVTVVDRTGGGDAFDAGFLSAWAEARSFEACLRRGLHLAAHVIAHAGSRPEGVDVATGQPCKA
jgi:sugar/nucleoside kinase (ribokinase family)